MAGPKEHWKFSAPPDRFDTRDMGGTSCCNWLGLFLPWLGSKFLSLYAASVALCRRGGWVVGVTRTDSPQAHCSG